MHKIIEACKSIFKVRIGSQVDNGKTTNHKAPIKKLGGGIKSGIKIKDYYEQKYKTVHSAKMTVSSSKIPFRLRIVPKNSKNKLDIRYTLNHIYHTHDSMIAGTTNEILFIGIGFHEIRITEKQLIEG